VAVLLVALVAMGLVYAAVNARTAAKAADGTSASAIEQGKKLFAEGCSSCHGLGAQGTGSGPSLLGVGAAGVTFQVGTGRMPLAAPGEQAMTKPPVYNDAEVAAMAAYIASLAPGPAVPTAAQLDTSNADLAEGGELFRTNCSQCHNFTGKGGALTDGKYAPNLMNATPAQIYMAMITGPQQMPVFSNQTLTVENKQAIIKWVEHLQNSPSPGGLDLGGFGPVTEGLFLWIVGIGLLIVAAVWIGARVR
jgi:ubiquinol-cytochrome c reductase cytochrome c subunit